jgi:hypothetical protein
MSLTNKKEAIKNRRIALEQLKKHSEMVNKFKLDCENANKSWDWQYMVRILAYVLLVSGSIVAITMGVLNELNF